MKFSRQIFLTCTHCIRDKDWCILPLSAFIRHCIVCINSFIITQQKTINFTHIVFCLSIFCRMICLHVKGHQLHRFILRIFNCYHSICWRVKRFKRTMLILFLFFHFYINYWIYIPGNYLNLKLNPHAIPSTINLISFYCKQFPVVIRKLYPVF